MRVRLVSTKDGGRIAFLVHGTNRGRGDMTLDGIWANGLYRGGLAGGKLHVYLSTDEWVDKREEDFSGERFEEVWGRFVGTVWPYFGAAHYDIGVIVGVDRCIKAGVPLWQTVAAAALADHSIPPSCILFIICLKTGKTLRQFGELTFQEWKATLVAEQSPQDEVSSPAEAAPTPPGTAASRALISAREFTEEYARLMCSSRTCRLRVPFGNGYCGKCGMPAVAVPSRIKEKSHAQDLRSVAPLARHLLALQQQFLADLKSLRVRIP